MEPAKVTAKGHIAIPIGIRRKLGVRNGDKILFVEEAGRTYIVNPTKDMGETDSIITVGDMPNV